MANGLHRCGGVLEAAPVGLSMRRDIFEYELALPGYVCTRCHERLLDRDVARMAEKQFWAWGSPRIDDAPYTVLTSYGPGILHLTGGQTFLTSSAHTLEPLVALQRQELLGAPATNKLAA